METKDIIELIVLLVILLVFTGIRAKEYLLKRFRRKIELGDLVVYKVKNLSGRTIRLLMYVDGIEGSFLKVHNEKNSEGDFREYSIGFPEEYKIPEWIHKECVYPDTTLD
jgi:hypothetical protein